MHYAKIAGSVSWSQGRTLLRKGQSIEDDHPLLEERPDLFTDQEPPADIHTPTRVETGRQGPGEHRMERAPARPPVIPAPPRGA